jgi:hypothetical protein
MGLPWDSERSGPQDTPEVGGRGAAEVAGRTAGSVSRRGPAARRYAGAPARNRYAGRESQARSSRRDYADAKRHGAASGAPPALEPEQVAANCPAGYSGE